VSHTVVENKSDTLYQSTILIVDDEPSARDTMEMFLFREGHELVFASSGREALKKAAELTPDLVLLDVMMPGMDGFEVCQRLRADPVLAEVPIILVTALDDRDSCLRGIEIGADDFLAKPVDRIKLVARVRSIIRLNRYRRLLLEQDRRRRAEEALRESEARSRRLFEDVPLGLYRISPEGRILEANAALVHMLGYPHREALLAANVIDSYLNPDRRGQWRALMRHEGVVRGFEVQLRRRDGTVIWVRDIARPILDNEGHVLYYEGSLEDITERRRAKEVLRQVDHLATLNAISAAAVSSLGLDTALRRVLELTCQALDATTGSILVLDPDSERLLLVLTLADEMRDLRGQALMLGQGIAGWVAQYGQAVRVTDVRQDARWHDGIDAITGFETRSLLCAPLKHRGRIAGVIEIVNKQRGDFTGEDLSLLEAVSSIAAAALENARLYEAVQARASELALLNEIGLALTSTLNRSTIVHAALNQVQRLFQADSVCLLQPDSRTGDLCFVKALTRTDLVERPIRVTSAESIAKQVFENRQPVLAKDLESVPRSLDLIDHSMGCKAGALMAAPLLARERASGVIIAVSNEAGIYTHEDLSTLQAIASTLAVALENASLYEELKALLYEWEQAQAQLIHAEKMTALGRLAASIAHEINNPLQAVQTYLTLAQERLAQEPVEALGRYLGTVDEEIERIATIVHRMRDFYRPASDGMRSTHLQAVLESVLALTNKQLQHSHITVECSWSDDVPEIEANPDHLKQVFLNLILNAIDAMPTGGMLQITTAVDQALGGAGQEPLLAARVEFSDTGKGMSPEVLSRLFEPFFTTKDGGTGLGLSISYGIIQAHGGQITVESYAEMGTTFTILLPVSQPLTGQESA
jgi:two-component system NtrC family sensor kinase